MKDRVFTVKRQIKELRILLLCLVFTFLLNIVAVIIYKTPWIEILTEVGYVVSVAIILYLIILLIRLIIFSVKALLGRP